MAVKLADIRKFDNGAKFYPADLHIHSFGASSDVTDASMTVESIVDAAVAQGISILSITDHNNDKNIEEALQYGSKYGDALLILPGVEITTAHGHLLAYFPADQPDSVGSLLSRINLVGKRGARDSHTAMSMADVIAEVHTLNGIAIAAHIDRKQTGFEMLAPGYPNWKRDVLLSQGLYGLEVDDAKHLIWYSPDDEPSAAGSERKKLLGLRRKQLETAARWQLAAIQNSDAHNIQGFGSQHQKRFFTKLKMNDLGFDGFRMSLADPEARVRAVATIPPSIPRILGMHVEGGFLDGATIQLSDNLNCFIGGRGTGKSTAIQSLAYGLGIKDELEEQDNCPDRIVVYCRDANGILYRYERLRGQLPTVRATEGQAAKDAPSDSFRIEFYGQGELAEVAKDPLRNAGLLQAFLDRHIVLADLLEAENALVQELTQNSAQLIPLEAAAGQLSSKRASLINVNTKLQIAETGKVKEIAGFQSRLTAEKSLSEALTGVSTLYTTGLTLSKFLRDFDAMVAEVGDITTDPECSRLLTEAKQLITDANSFLRSKETEINKGLNAFGQKLHKVIADLKAQHNRLSQSIAGKVAELQQKGLSGGIRELDSLLRNKSSLTAEISRIVNQQIPLQELRTHRAELLLALSDNRSQQLARRKGQLNAINVNLRRMIGDYAINLLYDPSGIIGDFKTLVLDVMQGTYFPEDAAQTLCSRITPYDLAQLVRSNDANSIAAQCNISIDWARQLLSRFQDLTRLHDLEIEAKPARPIIRVLTRESQPRQIPVNQLSDGQKHTILLTIAMLAESNVPLLMDQPEDDLDNAFIFNSVVSNLRGIKERRQVILVTHNANIAVLGDSELLLPMRREASIGRVVERGSIDRPPTKSAVQQILEGGELAFQRRKEIYGY
jgi:PHP domain